MLIYIAIILPAVLVGVGLALYFFQEYMVFSPQKLSSNYQYQFKGDFEELNYETPDGCIINALFFKAKNSKGIIFYQHGNADSLASWGERADDFTKENYDILMYDYRGFGKSTGRIKSEKMIYNDALMIYNELLNKYDEDSIIVYGMSLGTGVAAKLAAEKKPKLLILETPFFNFYDVAKFHYPYLPNSILLNYQFKTNKLLPNIAVPIFLIHGTEDETVPYNSSIRLLELSDNVELFTIDNGLHNNLNTFDSYHGVLKKLLKN